MLFISLVRGGKGEIRDEVWIQRLCLGVLFALGAAAGYLYAHSVGEEMLSELSTYLDGYCSLFSQEKTANISLISAFFLYHSQLLAEFFFGFTPLGVFLVPAVPALYGFSAMYACTCFAMVYGRSGVLLAMAVMGIRLVFTLPCLLWVGSHAWAAASSRFPTGKGKRCAAVSCVGSDWTRLFVCVVLLLIGVCAERYVTPALLHLALQAL